jgi:hypothetical protein
MSNANMQLVTVAVDPACEDPIQKLDEGEFIDVLFFPVENLLDQLTDYCKVIV